MDISNKNCKNSNSNLISHFISTNPLNKAFFDKDNIDFLQNTIRCKVNENLKYRIGRQSDDQLTIVMRSIYLQYGRNQPDNIQSQVDRLNDKVISSVMPQMISAVRQHVAYVDTLDSSGRQKIPVPMPHAKNVSSAGTKTLSMFRPL